MSKIHSPRHGNSSENIPWVIRNLNAGLADGAERLRYFYQVVRRILERFQSVFGLLEEGEMFPVVFARSALYVLISY